MAVLEASCLVRPRPREMRSRSESLDEGPEAFHVLAEPSNPSPKSRLTVLAPCCPGLMAMKPMVASPLAH